MVREVFTERLNVRQITSGRTRAVAVAAVLTVVCVVTITRGFADQIALDIFFSLTLVGCTIVFLSVRSWREFPQAVAAGLALDGLQALVLRTPLKLLPALAFVGLGSLALLAVRIWFSREDRQLLRDATVPPLLYVLPFFIMLSYSRQLLRNRSLAMTYFVAFVIAGPLGVVFYNLVPGGGPGNLFGSNYPLHPLTVEQLRQLPIQLLTVGGPRNAFPSLHLVWALLASWYAEGLSRWTKLAFFFFFFVATVISTLGLGEHYFIDLVTAFPFALMIHAACVPSAPTSYARRVVPLAAGVARMVGWMVLLRWGVWLVWINPAVPWLLSATTIGVTVFLQRRLRPLLSISLNGALPSGEA